MNKHSMIFIGLDTHKEFHEVAYSEEQRGARPVHYGRIPSSKVSVKKLLRQFESKYPGATLHFVYEAGPCGYWIYRLITSLGHCCYVVAPSLIPKKPGEHIWETDYVIQISDGTKVRSVGEIHLDTLIFSGTNYSVDE